jgi:lipid A 3-O-deacylase
MPQVFSTQPPLTQAPKNMHSNCARLLLIFFYFLNFCQELKAEEAALPWTLNVYFENDLFGQSDRNYTNGIRFSWISPDISSYESDERLPSWLRDTNDFLHFFHDRSQLKRCSAARKEKTKGDCLSRNLVVSFGQLIYTPENVESASLIKTDRPYAGYLYMGFAYHTRSDNRLDSIEFDIGLVGPASLAQESQDFIHDLRDFDKFQGWDNQLDNELGLGMLYERKQRAFRRSFFQEQLQHDFITHAGLSLGTVSTYLNTGFEYRIGRYLPDDFGTSSVRPGGDSASPGRQDPRLRRNFLSGVHLFIAADARLVARDIFLDGNTFEDSHSISKKRMVGDISIGINFVSGRWKFSYAQVFRSKEFDQQPNSHEYGSMTISYVF